MQSPTTEQLQQYLKKCFELESSIYAQEQVIKNSSKQIENYSNYRNLPSKPVMPEIYCEKPDVEFVAPSTPVFLEWYEKIKNYPVLYGGGAFALLGLLLRIYPDGLFFYFLVIMGVPILIGITMESYKKILEFENRRAYDKACVQAEERYNQAKKEAMATYQADMDRYNQALKKKQTEIESRKSNARASINKLSIAKEDTANILESLYNIGWVYPKYRNFVAISAIYEYLASGRCTELTGPNGAYNLYEAELRQNMIIAKLDQVLKSLEQIKRNQFLLYQELQKSNSAVERISRDVDQLLGSARRIEQCAELSAHYSRITAQNTEAIKYINLINR